MVDGKYYMINYSSKANWNIIQEFMHPVSFIQKAKGNGGDGEISLNYKINSLLAIKLNGRFSKLVTDKGVDESFLKNGNHIYTQFNGASYDTFGFQIGAVLTLP